MSLSVSQRGRMRKENASTVFDLKCIRTSGWVRRVEFEPSLPSTNDRALELAGKRSLGVPLLVITDCQTAGRGRGDHRWWSAPGALTFSLVLEAAAEGLQPCQWPQVSLTAAVAMLDVLKEIVPGVPAGLRWPNDVYLGGRKICGVLVEPAGAAPSAVRSQRSGPGEPPDSPTRPSSYRRNRLVVGLGMNVNNSLTDAPCDVRTVGTSLFDLTGNRFDLTETLLRILNRIEERLAWLAGNDPRLAEAWQQHCLLRGQTVTVDVGSHVVRGRCYGIDQKGALLVQTEERIEKLYGGVTSAVQ